MHNFEYSSSQNSALNTPIIQDVVSYLFRNKDVDEDIFRHQLFQDLNLAIENLQWQRRSKYRPLPGEILITSKERIMEILEQAHTYLGAGKAENLNYAEIFEIFHRNFSKADLGDLKYSHGQLTLQLAQGESLDKTPIPDDVLSNITCDIEAMYGNRNDSNLYNSAKTDSFSALVFDAMHTQQVLDMLDIEPYSCV
jgi:hypothetical protein